MNKREIAIVMLLFGTLLAWLFLQPGRRTPGQESQSVEEQSPAESPDLSQPEDTEETPDPPEEKTEQAFEQIARSRLLLPEQRIVISNRLARVTVSSWGGGIVSAELPDYRASVESDSGPLVLDFSARPALSYVDVPGLTTNNDFKIEQESDSTVSMKAGFGENIVFKRTICADGQSRFKITDSFVNTGADAVKLPRRRVTVGPMSMIQTRAKTRGISYLGIDSLDYDGGRDVDHWGQNQFYKFFLGRGRPRFSCSRPDLTGVGNEVVNNLDRPVSWIAAKNKFFVQILEPSGSDTAAELYVARDMSVSNDLAISVVAGSLLHAEKVLQPGETVTQEMAYYVGPKQHSLLKEFGNREDEVMQFGFFKPVCKVLLPLLNGIYAVIPNYGVAIILLTAIVRLLFWPITHKSTESMKKMQKIQPLVSELRTKYKDKPQKMNQEIMALYKEHKVNPMAGCLPILVQIPVFIALFTVLRSAVELRFAGFLWIKDLSEPEGLLAGILPIPLNILPVFMTVTMIWQQKLTPTTGDPQQQKMMMYMPVVMLVLFYQMASALVLYWSTSQCLSIAQLLLQQRKKDSAGIRGKT